MMRQVLTNRAAAAGAATQALRWARPGRALATTASTPPAAGFDPGVDHYPSRVASASMMERAHPVVWADKPRPGPLSRDQLAHYDRNGYVLMHNAFAPQEVDALRTELERIRNFYEGRADEGDNDGLGHRVTDKSRAVTEPGSGVLRSVFEVHKRNRVCNTLCRDARILNAAQQILDDDVYIHQSRVNFQQPFKGSGFYWHSDVETWHAEDGIPLPRATSAVVLLSDNNSTNGALMVIPGSHKVFIQCPGETPSANWESSLREPQHYGTPPGDFLRQLADQHGIDYCSAQAGSVLLFDCNLLHASHSNVSPWGRMNAFFVYNAVSNRARDRPYAAPTLRPEHIATHDPEWMKPLQVIDGPDYDSIVGDARYDYDLSRD